MKRLPLPVPERVTHKRGMLALLHLPAFRFILRKSAYTVEAVNWAMRTRRRMLALGTPTRGGWRWRVRRFRR